jgi:hypothetical protein
MKERKVTSDKMMCDARRFVQNIDLAAQYILRLFKVVACGLSRSGFDLVES